MKRILDVLISVNIILVSLPFVIIFIFFIYINDFKNPIYFAKRVGLKFKPITVYKLRSMTTSQNTNFQSTSDEDPRITKVGRIIRRYKIDEFVQFYNVLFGNISIVGPRPNVQDDVMKYTSLERKILSVKPGITDFSSIVFSDEGSILKNSENPDLDYNKFIRPWKSRLAILYIENMSITIDIKLIFLTFYNLINRKKTLIYLNSILKEITSDQELLNISLRESELYEKEPPK